MRIPSELACSSWHIDLVIERQCDELRIRPAQRHIGDVVISAITLAELEYGVACLGASEPANRERNRDALDKLIASHAIALGVTLVINNESDFITYPGLKIENCVNSH